MANALDCFFKCVGDEPEHAADFAEEIATELPDFLHRDDWVCRKRYAIRSASLGVGHVHREVALVLPLEKKKVKACSTLNVL